MIEIEATLAGEPAEPMVEIRLRDIAWPEHGYAQVVPVAQIPALLDEIRRAASLPTSGTAISPEASEAMQHHYAHTPGERRPAETVLVAEIERLSGMRIGDA